MTVHGFLCLDKPAGVTSRAALDRAARWFPCGTRLGHTGTLDPLATGVLVLALGQATRLTDYVQRMEKVYRAGIRLDGRSATDDAEGTITPCVADPPPLPRVEETLRDFTGAIMQVPPQHSAAKVAGRRAYDLARRGQPVELAPRPVQIHAIHLLDYQYPELTIEVRCGKGTYLRSLARDLGDRLGCGGYIRTLRRLRVGPFDEAVSVPLTAERDEARRAVVAPARALTELPAVALSEDEALRFSCGQIVSITPEAACGEVAVFRSTGALIGVGQSEAGAVRPERVLFGVPAS